MLLGASRLLAEDPSFVAFELGAPAARAYGRSDDDPAIAVGGFP